MPRSLINIIGVVVVIAVLALGILLVALPIGFQALGVVGQTATVANTNALYQTQIDALRQEEERLDEIQASVVDLQSQITPANELDDVFELVANSAAATGVSITGITAGDATAFVARTSPSTLDEAAQPAPEAPAPAPTSDPAATPAPTDPTTAPDASASGAAGGAASVPAGRTQVDFSVNVTASSLEQVIGFLDALRGGPRLLGQVQTTVNPTGTGFDVTLSALTFVLPEEG